MREVGMGNNNTKDAAPVLGESSNTEESPWIQRDKLPNQAIAILGRETRELRILDLKNGTSRICSAKISDHKSCGIVTINDEVYAVTVKEILKVHADGSVTTLQLLEGVDLVAQVVSFQKKIYIVQLLGLNMLCFDPDNNSFNDTLPGCGLGPGFCASSSHNFIFAMGGVGTKKSAMKFDPLENTWTKIPSMTTDRFFAAAACTDERIYVAGGDDEKIKEIKSAEFYSSDKNIWTRIPNMNIGRSFFSICVIGNQLYAIVGDNQQPYSVEVHDGNQWMMVTKFEQKELWTHACIWPHSQPEPSTNIDEEYQKLKQSHATTITKGIGEKGGKFKISGCQVRLPPGAFRGEREITFFAHVDQSQEKGLLSITPVLQCDPPMKLDKAATVTMRTSISANAGETIPVTLFTQKHQQDKWEETEQLNLRERNEVEFKVTECSGMKVATKSCKGKFHLISDFYIQPQTALTAVIFSKDEVIQSLTRKQLHEDGFHKFALASHDVLVDVGSEISVSMEGKEPAECSVTGGFPSSTFTVDEDYHEKGKKDIYYELEPEPSDQCKKVRMLFGYKIGDEKEHYLPLKSKWPPTKPETVTTTGLTIVGDVTIQDSELNVNAGGEGSCMKIDKSITAGKYNTGHSQTTSIGETNIAQRK